MVDINVLWSDSHFLYLFPRFKWTILTLNDPISFLSWLFTVWPSFYDWKRYGLCFYNLDLCSLLWKALSYLDGLSKIPGNNRRVDFKTLTSGNDYSDINSICPDPCEITLNDLTMTSINVAGIVSDGKLLTWLRFFSSIEVLADDCLLACSLPVLLFIGSFLYWSLLWNLFLYFDMILYNFILTMRSSRLILRLDLDQN